MSRVRSFAVLVCALSVANAWGAGFFDDFDRPNGLVGNGWSTQTDGTITVEIVDGEVLVAGTQGTDWVRCGISRAVSDETKISFDFQADDSFNIHVRVDSADSSAFVEVYTYPGGPLNYASSPDGSWPGWTAFTGAGVNIVGEQNTLMLEQDGTEITVTLNGAVVGTITNAGFTSIENVLISSDAAAGTTGSLHIDNVLIGELVLGTAKNPSPASGATDVPQDVVLGWTAGEYAATHDVYFGTTLQEVADATTANPGTVLVSPGQTDAAYEPADLLEFGQTYYWRVDEVNGAPDNTVLTGEVWSFTVEPYVYPITDVTATASSFQAGMGPENTVNGSGLNANDEHSTDLAQMWMSDGDPPNWIQYEFDKAYKLHELWVWNSNQLIESFVGFGAKNVTVEYSTDGATWTTLEGAPQFAQATAAPTYTANTVVDFAGATAKYVKLTIDTTWGGVAPQTSLSEVRFFYIPAHARGPEPADAAMDVPIDATLNWRQGREAESHEVFLGTDANALTLADTPTDHSYTPDALSFGTTYYWKVNEIGGGGPYEGDIWSFTTQEFATIDDMESYDDDVDAQTTIWHTWIDGLTTGASGSQVGYDVAPFAERIIVHGGMQALPLAYDNSAAPFFSEAEREFASTQDWTANGADALGLWVQGIPAAYSEDNGVITMSAGGHDIWDNADDFRFAYKTLNGDGSIVVKVESLVNTNAWAKAGVMIRQSLDADSKFVYMIESFSSGVSMGWRPTTAAGCDSTTQAAIAAPQWVKLIRKGDVFTAQYSADGAAWTDLKAADGTVASTTVSMTGPVYIGLCVTSHNPAAMTTAVMSGAAATGNVTGASWEVLAIGDDPQPANAPGELYVTVEDSSGKSATATNATAVTTGIWTQWQIPLSDFAGVNMARVKKLILGVDSRNSTTKGGGLIYVDDIGYGKPLTGQ